MYIIKKVNRLIEDKVWDTAQIAKINVKNWKQFEYQPETYAKLLYNDFGIYVQLTTFESPLLARATKQNDDVYLESCMELFLRPNENDVRYMNFEFNPFGTMYFAIRSSRYDPVLPEENKHYFNVKSNVENDKWVLEFVIPFELINKYFGSHTKKMYGNLYKCRETPDTVHFLSYYPLNPDKIDFHLSEYFGEFVLE